MQPTSKPQTLILIPWPQVSGPVAIVAVGAEVARVDSAGLFQFAAIVSINLAVVNALPLPALDGGYMFLLVRLNPTPHTRWPYHLVTLSISCLCLKSILRCKTSRPILCCHVMAITCEC